jgi:L-fuculose-phosphate aldolase
VLATRAGCHKGMLTDDDLVVLDAQGRKLRGRGTPTSEIAMHLACYAERPDIHAVLHAHPPLAIACTVAGVSLERCVLPEVVLTLGTIPTVAYATTGTQALADAIRPAVRAHDAILMDRHGAVCLGADLLTAFCHLETVEQVAQIVRDARAMGAVRELPADEARHLRELGLTRYGGPPAARATLGTAELDLPAACTSCAPSAEALEERLTRAVLTQLRVRPPGA